MRCVRNCHAPASPRTRTVCANRCADVPTVANVHDVAAMRPTTATSMLAYSIDPCVCCVLVVRSNVFNAPTTSTGWYLFIFLLVVFLFLLFLFSVALVTCCVCVCMCVLLATRFWLVELFHGYTICIYLFIHICQVYTLFDNSKYTRRWRRVLCTSPWLLFRRYILLSCSLSGISNTSGTGCGLWEVYDDGLRVKLLAYINSLIDCESMKYSINWISIDDDVDFADRQWWWALWLIENYVIHSELLLNADTNCYINTFQFVCRISMEWLVRVMSGCLSIRSAAIDFISCWSMLCNENEIQNKKRCVIYYSKFSLVDAPHPPCGLTLTINVGYIFARTNAHVHRAN